MYHDDDELMMCQCCTISSDSITSTPLFPTAL